MNRLEQIETMKPELTKHLDELVSKIQNYDGVTPGKQLLKEFKKAGISLPKTKRDIVDVYVSVTHTAIDFINELGKDLPKEETQEFKDTIQQAVNEITERTLNTMEVKYDHNKQEILDSIASELNITLDENMKGPLWLAYLKGIGLTDDQYRRELNVVEIEMP